MNRGVLRGRNVKLVVVVVAPSNSKGESFTHSAVYDPSICL